MTNPLRIDFWVILGIVIFSIPIILIFEVKPLTSALFFFIIPTVYLFIRKRKPIKRVLLGSLLIGVLIGFTLDIILTVNKSWYIPSSQLVFNYKIYNFWPVDELIWFFLWALFIIVFYEHFYDRERKGRVSKRFKYLAVPAALILFFVLWALAAKTTSFSLPYTYFILALLAVIPIGYVVIKLPSLIPKFFKTGIFFFMLYLVYELTAVKLGQWYFPGEYIGWVNLAGIRFPFEELFFWMTLSNFTVLSLYEGFIDDDK